jgi:signal transduction histidine kinase
MEPSRHGSDAATPTRETGTGLGLSIVRRIAELHRASVQFRDGAGGRGLAVVVEFAAA